MNCKHVEVRGNTTKYYYCKVFDKAVDDYKCRKCVMRLPDLPEGFEQIFRGFRRK